MGFSKESERDVLFDTFNYTYSSDLTMDDPGEGLIRLNASQLRDVTSLVISATDDLGRGISKILSLFTSGIITLRFKQTIDVSKDDDEPGGGGVQLRSANTTITNITNRTDNNTWFEIEFTSFSTRRREPIEGTEVVISFKSTFDSFKFDTIGENTGTPWRSFTSSGSGGIGAGNLDYCVVGINLKEEIEKKWGSVDTSNYMYTVGLGLKRTNASGTKCHILGFSSLNANPRADRVNDIGAPNFGWGSQFQPENGGLFCGSALYNINGTFNQAGAIQSKSYFGAVNTTFDTGGRNFFWDFANEGYHTMNLCGRTTRCENAKSPKAGYRNELFKDLGNCSTIRTASTVGAAISSQTLSSDKTTYFWFSFNNPLQGSDFSPNRHPSTTAIFMGGGFDTPYNNIFKNAYPSSNLHRTGGEEPGVGLIAPASTSHTQRGDIINSYYDGDQTFDELTTFIFRVKIYPGNIKPEDRKSVWFFDSVDDKGNYSNGYQSTTAGNLNARNMQNHFGFKFYRYCKFNSWKNWLDDIPTTNPINSRMWNDNFSVEWESGLNFVLPFPGSNPDTDMQAVKGVGNYLFLAKKSVGHCFNLDVCQTVPNYSTFDNVPCTTKDNAVSCVSSVNVESPGALGWDAAENLNAYCVRFPEDPLCGCVNTINNDNIVDFVRILEEETKIDFPNYCFSKACTDPSQDTWIDPRIDFEANCNINLTLCLVLIDIAGNNNIIQDTDIYQDCSDLVGNKGNGGGGGGGGASSSSSTFLIAGAIFAVLIIGLVIFFIVRSRGK